MPPEASGEDIGEMRSTQAARCAMEPRYGPEVALVVVDVQHDFAHPDGGLYVQGGEAVVDAVNREVRRAREAGALVVYTQDWHPPRTPHFDTDGGVWPVHCVQDTWGAALHHELEVDGPVVRKGTGGEDGYSGFSVRDPETGEEGATELDRVLRVRGIEEVMVVGLAQDVCVRATALDAVERGYRTTLLLDATAPVEQQPGDGARAVEELQQAGVAVLPGSAPEPRGA
jgi:nicotinamidase/pyrazinamidase